MEINRDLILSILEKKENIFRPNQAKVSLPIITRICKKMKHKIRFRPIHVSDDNLIIDGHHRYISSILLGIDIGIVSNIITPLQVI